MSTQLYVANAVVAGRIHSHEEQALLRTVELARRQERRERRDARRARRTAR